MDKGRSRTVAPETQDSCSDILRVDWVSETQELWGLKPDLGPSGIRWRTPGVAARGDQARRFLGRGRKIRLKWWGIGSPYLAYLAYLLRWQLSTPILWVVVSLLGASIQATVLANLIGGAIFFWVDRMILRR